MRNSASLFTARAGLLAGALLTIGLLGCDSGEEAEAVALRSMPEGSTPSAAPTPCGDAAELPDNASLVSTADDKVLVSVGFEDVQKAMTGVTAIEYWCTCDDASGACQVQVVGGKYVQCYSKSCKKCTLNSGKASAITAVGHLETTCDPAEFDDARAQARADEVQAWVADQGYPELEFSNEQHEAAAPEGYGLVVEFVGGRALTYPVPLDNFDENGELINFVGPDNSGGDYVAQVVGGLRLDCYCDGGAGMCGFEASGLCKGLCDISGGGRGCVVKSSKELIPITW